ncbi:MAG: metal ABC transporter permease, partial [Pseudomonadota bacterium]
IALAVSIGSCIFGTIVSFHIDGATGACIVLTQAFVFLLAFLFGPKRGLWPIRALLHRADSPDETQSQSSAKANTG